jgi:hypothetical protein
MDKYDLSAQKFGAVGMDAPDPYDLAAAKFGGREVVPPGGFRKKLRLTPQRAWARSTSFWPVLARV